VTDFIPLKKWLGGIGEAESGDKVPAAFLPVAALAVAFGALVCVASGTANAQVLTPVYSAAAPAAYVDGAEYSTKFATTNTGATTINIAGLGAKTAVTVTGAALPAGYLRTDVRTRLWYDAASNRLVVDRETEYDNNTNGEFWKYADGRMTCLSPTFSVAISTTAGSVFSSGSATPTWTFPAEFAAIPFVVSTPLTNSSTWGGGNPGASTTSSNLRVFSTGSIASSSVKGCAEGRWYQP
jgi:hypothetical protein